MPVTDPQVVGARRSPRGRLAVDITIAILLTPLVLYFAARHFHKTNGVVDVADDEVAVVVDALSGERSISTVPGYRLFMPWKQDVYKLDKSPDELVFEGVKYVSPNVVPFIELRGKDGSRFNFDRFSLQYALIASAADRVLEDSGPEDGFKQNLVRVYARAYLRDQINRLDPDEILRPDVVRAAMTSVMERLNTALNPHGIEVLEVATPKPTFDKGFEDLLNRRKHGDLEVARLQTHLTLLPTERDRRLKAIREDKARELSTLRLNLSKNEAAADREFMRLTTEADIYYANRVRSGEAALVELNARASGLRARYAGLMEDRQREIENLEKYGEFAVRAALVRGLADVRFEMLPYSRDPVPKRVEHEDLPVQRESHAQRN
ncbi:MAG: hypothetical protein JNL28_12085 [Planctomycetes bacterium]|nr:hypothetical protein [Planctomycetota bacterium]